MLKNKHHLKKAHFYLEFKNVRTKIRFGFLVVTRCVCSLLFILGLICFFVFVFVFVSLKFLFESKLKILIEMFEKKEIGEKRDRKEQLAKALKQLTYELY